MNKPPIKLRLRQHRRTAGNHGIALLLVFIIMAMTVILALSFLHAQITSTGITSNVKRESTARMIAESALNIGIAQVKTDANWRTDFTNGVWVTNQSYLGGTFTLKGEDGTLNASDVVVGDGSLSNNPTDLITLTAIGAYQGVTHIARVQIRPTAVGGPGNGVTVNAQISMSNSAVINGNVYVGPGGDPSKVVSLNNGASITGTWTAQSSAAAIAPIAPPVGLPASAGSRHYSNSGSTTITTGTYHYNNFTVSNSYLVHISGNVVIYCDGRFSLSNSTEVILDPGATLTLYTSNFNLSNSAGMNMPASGAPNPSNVTIYYTGAGTVSLSNSFTLCAKLYAPNGALQMSNSTRLFGLFQGRSIQLSNSARFTQDLAITGGGGGGGSGSYTYDAIWMEQP